MSLWEKIRGNPIDRMKIRDLRTQDIRLTNRTDRLRKEIDVIEKKKKKLFQQGVGTSTIQKKIISQEITGLDMEAKLKLKNFTTIQGMLMYVKNLVVLKNYEKELKNKGFWKNIVEIPPDQLEGYLIKLRLEGKEFDEVLSQLNQTIEMDVIDSTNEEGSESEKKLFDIWDQVESGSMDVSDAESNLTIDKESDDKEEA